MSITPGRIKTPNGPLSALSYDENGNCKGIPEFTPPTPTRVTWDLNNNACLAAIEDAHIGAQKLLNVSVEASFISSVSDLKKSPLVSLLGRGAAYLRARCVRQGSDEEVPSVAGRLHPDGPAIGVLQGRRQVLADLRGVHDAAVP